MRRDKAQSGAPEPALEPVDFIYENHKIRAFDDGEKIWLIADDLAVVLGYSQADRLTRVIDDDEKGTHTVRTLGGPQELLTVSESGCYHAIFKSRKPGAQKFRRWITETVIPEIARTGR
ncbi:BRO-N domain-containing protein, partial [Acidiphilium sp.]|uniref:BRO-N domain-containing protein n=1 Tax=Acidiphilium sp. TaxID=527 RepID=UPI003CFFC976